MSEIRRIARELVAKGSIIDYYKDTMELPNGNVVKWDHIEHKGAAAVIPVLDNGNIVMVKQFRNAIERSIWEIPAGGLDGKEEPSKIAAIRELKEETGYESEQVEFLITIHTTVAFCSEKIDIYVAHDLQRGEQKLDENEFVEVKEFSLSELCEMIYAGEITDSKTISALMAYKSKYQR